MTWLFCARLPHRYLVAALSFILLLLSVGYRACFALMATHISSLANSGINRTTVSSNSSHFPHCPAPTMRVDWTGSTVSLFNTAYFAGQFVISIPAGAIVMRCSPKRVFGLTVLGTSVCQVLLPVASQTHAGVTYFIRTLQGLFEAANFPALNAVISMWAPAHQKARLMNICYAGAYLSPAVAMFVSGATSCYVSWDCHMYIYGAVGIFWCLPWMVMIQASPVSLESSQMSRKESQISVEISNKPEQESRPAVEPSHASQNQTKSVNISPPKFIHQTSGSDQNVPMKESDLNSNFVEPNLKVSIIEPNLKVSIIEPDLKVSIIEPNLKVSIIEPDLKVSTIEPNLKVSIIEPNLKVSIIEPNLKVSLVEPDLKESIIEPDLKASIIEPDLKLSIIDPDLKEPIIEPDSIASIIESDLKGCITEPVDSIYGSMKTEPVPWGKILTSLPMLAIWVGAFTRSFMFGLLLTEIQQYYKDVYDVPASINGLLSGVPQIFMTVFMVAGALIFDTLIKKDILSVTNTRKLAQCLGFGVQGACTLAVGFVEDYFRACVLLCVGAAFSGFAISGYQTNVLDIAPKYTGPLTGIYRTGMLGSVLSTTLTSVLTGNSHSLVGWQHVFIIAGSIHLGGVVFYAVFASGDLQPWAQPGSVSKCPAHVLEPAPVTTSPQVYQTTQL